jgi:predicted ATPase
MRLYLPYLSSSPLRGRETDIEDIQSSINVTSPKILQLVGTGGLGKSRLAAEVALSHTSGAIWHRCSSVSEPAELIGLLR